MDESREKKVWENILSITITINVTMFWHSLINVDAKEGELLLNDKRHYEESGTWNVEEYKRDWDVIFWNVVKGVENYFTCHNRLNLRYNTIIKTLKLIFNSRWKFDLLNSMWLEKNYYHLNPFSFDFHHFSNQKISLLEL